MHKRTRYTSYQKLVLQRPTPRPEREFGNVLQNVETAREKLLEEIEMLESRMEQVRAAGSPMDFSLIQTYKEMIHSRRMLFIDLSR